jgi:hypothetical protein
MLEALKAWERLAERHNLDSRINKYQIECAVFEGKKVMAMLDNLDHDRSDAYWHFGRVAALYTASGLFGL